MMNKKGELGMETAVKIIVVLIVFIVLIATFTGVFGRTKKAALNLIHKEYEKFQYVGGSFIHPDLFKTDLADFWLTGFKNFVKQAVTADSPCLGSFYIDDRWDMEGTSLHFIQTDTGIELKLEDSQGITGVFDNKTFVNDENHQWKLCVFDEKTTNFNVFANELKISFNLGQSLSVADQTHTSWITSIHDATIDFKGKPKSEDIKVTYFTPEILEKKDTPPQIADYHAYEIMGAGWLDRGWKSIFSLFKGKRDRYLFFYVVSGNNFCLLPTTRNDKNVHAFNLDALRTLLKEKLAFNLEQPPYTGIHIDNPDFKTFCPIPGAKNAIEKSIFNGYGSCYFYGCDDIVKDKCNLLFEKCKGLCSLYITGGAAGIQCNSCQTIKKCSDYNDVDFCSKDLCDLGCKYDVVEKACIPRPTAG
jgi:hypothetical protein